MLNVWSVLVGRGKKLRFVLTWRVHYTPFDLIKAHRMAVRGVLSAQNRRSQARGTIMPDKEKLQHVGRENPCPVCGKPDWCLAAADGSAAICANRDPAS